MNLSVFSANIFDDSKTNEQNTSDSEKISEMTIIFEYKHLALNTQNALFAKKTVQSLFLCDASFLTYSLLLASMILRKKYSSSG